MKLTDYFEIKVFILYLMSNIAEPLEITTVTDMVVQDGFVNYFDFSICFGELLEAGQILEIQGSTEKLYHISEEGLVAIESYEESLYKPVKEQALRSALRLMAFKKDGNEISSRIIEVSSGYNVCCMIKDNSRVLYRTEVFVTELSYAQRLKLNFDERAENIYNVTLALLSGDINYLFDD